MKLSECTYGRLVQITDGSLEVGNIVGLTYNVSLKLTGGMPPAELLERTIPVVKFPSGERAIHSENLPHFT